MAGVGRGAQVLVFAKNKQTKKQKNTRFCFGHFELKKSVRSSSGDVRKVFSFRREVQPGDVHLRLVSIKVLKTMSIGRFN